MSIDTRIGCLDRAQETDCPPDKKVGGLTLCTFRTLKLGTGLKSFDGFLKAIKGANCEIGDWGKNLLRTMISVSAVATSQIEVELVVVSNLNLGVENGATMAETFECARRNNLNLCPGEVGPQLAIQYKDQPYGERLFIGMDPISDYECNLRIFVVERRSQSGWSWLCGHKSNPNLWRSADTKWVFLRQNNPKSNI